MSVQEAKHLRTLEHNLENAFCWCKPDLLRLCPEPGMDHSDCERCKGEGVVLALPIRGEIDLVKHHDME